MTKVYLELNKKELEKSMPQANKTAIESDKNDSNKKTKLLYDELAWVNPEYEFDEGEIHLWGDLVFEGKDLGYLDIQFKPEQDLIVDIIETYVKQLNKVKTLIEATK